MQGLVSADAALTACESCRAAASTCEKSFLLGVVFVAQWVHSKCIGAHTTTEKGAHTMAAHSTTQLDNGHTLTITEPANVPVSPPLFRVEERNGCGTYLHVAYTSKSLADAEAWVERARQRGYGLRPTVGPLMICWYDSADPASRRKMLSLSLSSPEGKRGTLHECERERPSDVWPQSHRLGSGYSVASAENMARQRGLTRAS